MKYEDDVVEVTGGSTLYTILRRNISHVSVSYLAYPNSQKLINATAYKVHLMNGEQISIEKEEYDRVKKILYGKDL